MKYHAVRQKMGFGIDLYRGKEKGVGIMREAMEERNERIAYCTVICTNKRSKTETIRGIIDANKSVMVLAPTGKAARLIERKISHPAYTIDSAILSPKVSEELSKVGVVVLYEPSMMETVFFTRLVEFLKKFNPVCRIVFVLGRCGGAS